MRMWRSAIVAGALLALTASSGHARRFEIENALSGFKGVWRPMTFPGVFGEIRCNVLLEGEFLRWTNLKGVGFQYGNVLIATVETCSEGRLTLAVETLPWPVNYASFQGTLPNITAITLDIVGMTGTITEPFVRCTFRTSTSWPARLTANREAGGAILTYTIGGTIPSSCGASGTVSGTGTANVQRSTTVRTRIYLLE